MSDLKKMLNKSVTNPPADAAEVAERLTAGSTRSTEVVPSARLIREAAVGDSRIADQHAEQPAFVYVPTRPYSGTSTPHGLMGVRLEVRSTDDGTEVLAVYTSENLLEEQLGAFQPRVRVSALELLVRLGPISVPVAVNPTIEPSAERWTAESVHDWNDQVGG
jgi:hypothetical protein